MKTDWCDVTLGDIFEISSSKRVLQKQWKSKGIPFYRAREIVKLAEHGTVQNDLFISEELFEEFKAKYCVPQPGDLMVSAVGTLGACYVVQPNDRFYFKDASVLRFKAKQPIHPRFIQYAFKTNLILDQINSGSGSTVGTYTISRAKETRLSLPPLADQKRIAAILDKADAIRRKRQQAIKLTADFLRANFLDMFGDPVTNPKGWEVKPLGEITFIDAPMVDPKKEKHLDLLHIGPNRIEKETGKLLTAKTAREDRLISGKFLFGKKHVLYSKIRPYLRKVALPDFSGLCSADMYPVRPDEKCLTREYLWSILISSAFTHFTESLPGRASIPKLNRKEFATYECMLPPIELQNKYTRVFNSSKEIEKQKTLSFNLESDLFNSLTQRAFRGEL